MKGYQYEKGEIVRAMVTGYPYREEIVRLNRTAGPDETFGRPLRVTVLTGRYAGQGRTIKRGHVVRGASRHEVRDAVEGEQARKVPGSWVRWPEVVRAITG